MKHTKKCSGKNYCDSNNKFGIQENLVLHYIIIIHLNYCDFYLFYYNFL